MSACRRAHLLQAAALGEALLREMPAHMREYFGRADFVGGDLVAVDPVRVP